MKTIFWIIFTWLVCATGVTEGSWGSPGDGQYHIQTDEGPERYFRFQTDNGQFRKERRLQDGTVIGTEAWIDAAGFLRQKDYIADKKGYRILKSKTVYVGQGRPIEDAIKSTKSVSAQSGVLVNGRKGLKGSVNSAVQPNDVSERGQIYTSTAFPPASPTTSTIPTTAEPEPPRLGYLSPEEAAKIEPSPYLGFDHYPDELPGPPRPHLPASEPVVEIRHHSEPIDDDSSNTISDDFKQQYLHYPSTTTTERPSPLYVSEGAGPGPVSAAAPLPSLSIEPPLAPTHRRFRPIGVVSSTPSPIPADEASLSSNPIVPYPSGPYEYSTPTPFLPASSSTPTSNGYHYAPSSASTYSEDVGVARLPSSPAVLPLEVNSLQGLLPPLSQKPNHHRRLRPHEQNNIISGFEEYDGIGTTRNGFRYFLPRHYHEEEQFDDQKRAGSFGYVDPFGIRRVVYYNASPGRGFVHRNNNHYVGLDAPPYDPIPIRVGV